MTLGDLATVLHANDDWPGGAITNVSLSGDRVTMTGSGHSVSKLRSTLNRANRSNRQTALSNLTGDQIKDLIGIFRTPCGVYFINPAVININQQALAAGQCSQLGSGRAANGFGQPTFPGEVFFNNGPGQDGNLPRAFINGPTYFNWDLGFIKNIRLTERTRIQLRAEAFNVLNRVNFGVTGTQQLGLFNINSTNFGRLTADFAPRILQFAARFEF